MIDFIFISKTVRSIILQTYMLMFLVYCLMVWHLTSLILMPVKNFFLPSSKAFLFLIS